MISLMFRIALICGSLITAGYMVKKIRQSKLQIEYSIFWMLFAASLVILSIFPEITIYGASLLGIYFLPTLFFADFCPFDSQSIPYDDRAFHIRISGERTGTETGNLRKNRAG